MRRMQYDYAPDSPQQYDDILAAMHAPPAAEWDTKKVLDRMEEAFSVLRKIPGATGPKSFGSNWPQFAREKDAGDLRQEAAMRGLIGIAIEDDWQELPDYLPAGIKYLAEAEAEKRRRLDRDADAPTKWDIGRMEEALGWPGRFLGGYAIGADALNTWAMCKGFGRSIDEKLAGRAKAAAELARYVEWQLNAKRSHARRQYAMDAAQWAQMRFRLSPKTREAIDRIMANARIRMQRDLDRANLASPLVFVEPAEVSPDKVISRTSLDRHRAAAAKRIADGLMQ